MLKSSRKRISHWRIVLLRLLVAIPFNRRVFKCNNCDLWIHIDNLEKHECFFHSDDEIVQPSRRKSRVETWFLNINNNA